MQDTRILSPRKAWAIQQVPDQSRLPVIPCPHKSKSDVKTAFESVLFLSHSRSCPAAPENSSFLGSELWDINKQHWLLIPGCPCSSWMKYSDFNGQRVHQDLLFPFQGISLSIVGVLSSPKYLPLPGLFDCMPGKPGPHSGLEGGISPADEMILWQLK